MPLQIIRQDITKIKCDAIVNPTNTNLNPTGGLDKALHDASGQKLKKAVRAIGHINVGEAVVTPAFNLNAKYVIHTAGPVYRGKSEEKTLLKSCYINSLKLAEENSCESIAFPLISSGTYGYPKDMVLKIAIDTISDFLFKHEMMVYLVVFDKKSYELSEKLFSDIKSFIDDNYAHDSLNRRSGFIRSKDMTAVSMLPTAPLRASVYRPIRAEHIDECNACDEKPIDIDSYIKLDESFSIKLLKLIDIKCMNDVECYKKANVSKQTWYKIMNDKYYKPNKKTVISFAVALKLTLEETQNLLESVGFVLSNSSLFDVIIMYCLENRIYDVLKIDSILFKYDQETLYSKL